MPNILLPKLFIECVKNEMQRIGRFPFHCKYINFDTHRIKSIKLSKQGLFLHIHLQPVRYKDFDEFKAKSKSITFDIRAIYTEALNMQSSRYPFLNEYRACIKQHKAIKERYEKELKQADELPKNTEK